MTIANTAVKRYALSPDDVADTVRRRLRAAARLEHVTARRVRRYCQYQGIREVRLERVLLREAFNVVDIDALVDRLVAHVRRRTRTAGTYELDRWALPVRLASLLEDVTEPGSITVERLLRFGLLTRKTRVQLLYWRRLRDYLIWACVTS